MDLQKLVVPLLANIDEFAKNLKEADKLADKTTSSIGSKFKTAGKVLAGVAAAGIGAFVTGAGVALNGTLEWGQSMDDLQDHLNSTNEQSAGLALMMKRVGGNTSDLTGAIDKMTKGLVDASGELGPTGKAIDSLGVSIYDANGKILPSVDLFQAIADKLAGMPEGLEKNALLMDIFGKSGVEMGDALGAAANGGIQSFIDQATNVGLVLSQEQIDKVIEYKKKVEDVGFAFEGIKVQAGLLILEAVEPLITSFNVWLTDSNNQQKIRDLSTAISGDLKAAIQDITKAIDFLKQNQWALDLIGLLGTITVTFVGASKVAGIFGVTLATLGGPVTLLIGAVGLLAWTIIRFGKDAWNTVDMLGKLFWLTFGQNIIKWLSGVRVAWDTFVGALRTGANWISNAISNTIGWIDRLIKKLSNLSIPSWLKPGSPPPLAYALMDINKQLKVASTNALPSFQAQLNASVGNSNSELVNAINNQQLTIDYNQLARAMRDSMLQVVG